MFEHGDILDFLRLSHGRPISSWYPALCTLEIRWGLPMLTKEDRENVKNFIRAFSNITHLIMWSKDHDQQFDVVMNHLIEDEGYSTGSVGLWPHLQSITIQSPFANDLDVVSAMVSARIAARRPIRQLILEHVAWPWQGKFGQPTCADRPPSSRRFDQIKELREKLNLEVRSGRTMFKGLNAYGMPDAVSSNANGEIKQPFNLQEYMLREKTPFARP
jgi:hypothetical protein